MTSLGPNFTVPSELAMVCDPFDKPITQGKIE